LRIIKTYDHGKNNLALKTDKVDCLKVKVCIDLAGDKREQLAGARWARTTKLFPILKKK
jgi:hypothetical protein